MIACLALWLIMSEVLTLTVDSKLNLQGKKRIPPEKTARIGELIESWFIFALLWSVGATGDAQSRFAFSTWFRAKMSVVKAS